MDNTANFKDYVRIGLEIGEHIDDFDNYITYIKENYDLSKLDFVLIMMKPIELRKSIWYEWANFFRENQIYFAFLYTQQRGAPKGKTSHLNKDIVHDLKNIAGEYFVGDMIGETGGLASWLEGYYEDLNIEKPVFKNLEEAKQNYVNHVASRVNIDRELNVPAVLAVEATLFNRYNFEAGVDHTAVEMMCGNPELMFASARGASKAYGKDWWASHIANEWYGGFRNDDPLKYKRLKIAYYYSFLSGAKYIYPESGDISISSYGYNFDSNSAFCKKYRSIWKDFSNFVHLHPRPKEGPIVKVAFLQGNLDSYTGWGGSTVWNRFGDKDWVYGTPERSWKMINSIYEGDKWHNPHLYGGEDTSFSAPYGQYDIVPVEAPLDILSQYDYLIFVGWNTMTDSIYENIKKYVYNGGKILAAIPHLNVNNVRDENYTLINKGDFSDLFGCIVKGSGKNLNWGVKFIKESIIPGCLYPYTSDGLCDPICADGTIKSADVTITGGQVTALLSDRFIKWKENSPPVVIENSYGKGFATLIASWDYPGAESMQKLYKIILKAILSGEQKKADIKVLCNDKIYYSVYSDTFASTVYLLNSDYNNSNKCNINYGEMTMEMEIPSCSMNIAYITPHFLCSPVENGLAINEIKETKNRIEIKVNGSGVQYMKWVLPKVQPNILVNGEPVTFDVSNGCYMSKHELLI